ncbi:MAG: hypothetical protein HY326_01005 [Chloroflexi bacterium]|nr:hypothetical protein [Chloroflexota bacterium]
MKLRSPFDWLPVAIQGRAFVPLLAGALVLMVSLQAIGGPLITAVAPQGIVSFELAGDLPADQGMMASWGPTGRIHAGLSLGLDYLFIVAYVGAIGLGCVLVARGLARRMAVASGAGTVLAWGLVGAGLLDMLENYALIRTLLGSQADVWPQVARWCAIPKFVIVAGGIGYVLIGAIVNVFGQVRRGGEAAAD